MVEQKPIVININTCGCSKEQMDEYVKAIEQANKDGIGVIINVSTNGMTAAQMSNAWN